MVPLTTAWKDAQDRRNRTIPFNLIMNDNTSIMILFNLNVTKNYAYVLYREINKIFEMSIVPSYKQDIKDNMLILSRVIYFCALNFESQMQESFFFK